MNGRMLCFLFQLLRVILAFISPTSVATNSVVRKIVKSAIIIAVTRLQSACCLSISVIVLTDVVGSAGLGFV